MTELTQAEKAECLHHQHLEEVEARLKALDVLCDLLRDQDWDELDLTLLRGQYLGGHGPWAARLEFAWDEGEQVQELLRMAGWTPPPPTRLYRGVDYGGKSGSALVLRAADGREVRGRTIDVVYLDEVRSDLDLLVAYNRILANLQSEAETARGRAEQSYPRGESSPDWSGPPPRGRPTPRRSRREWWNRRR